MRYVFYRGATIAVALDAISGDPGTVSGMPIAKIRKLAPGQKKLDSNDAPGTAMTVVARSASGEIPAGWTLSVASGALELGFYQVTASMVVGSDTIIADPITIDLREPAVG